ncbi:MAG TPA: hypothetical protein VG735_10660 [Caulobacterales bacterium]|nr:hypothetical protein [Caulobacterales bacterium]
MRDRMIEETQQLDADAYERRAEAGAKPKKTGAIIRIVVIAAMLVLAGGAITLNAGNKPEAAQPTAQEFAAANPKQIEPQQLTPKAEKPTPEQIAKVETPKSPPRPAARARAAKPRPIEAPTPPAAAVTPPPAQTIPEIAPIPSQIAPDAAAPL